jgi:hypothetical protein
MGIAAIYRKRNTSAPQKWSRNLGLALK